MVLDLRYVKIDRNLLLTDFSTFATIGSVFHFPQYFRIDFSRTSRLLLITSPRPTMFTAFAKVALHLWAMVMGSR